MENRIVALLVLALALPAPLAAEGKTKKKGLPPAPKAEEKVPLTVEVSPDNADVALHPTLYKSQTSYLGLSLRLGALAVADSFSNPYPILMPSPYVTGGISGIYSGAFEAAGFGTVGLVDVRSRKLFSDPNGDAVSSASAVPRQSEFSQKQWTGSLYGDLGKVYSLSPQLKGAFFAAASSFGMGAGMDGMTASGMADGNVGTMLMYNDKVNRVTLFADVRGEPAREKFYRNVGGQWEIATAVDTGAEVARKLGAHEVRAGVEVESRRADIGYRPYVGWAHGAVDTLVAGNIRHSNNDFYPDVNGAGAQVSTELMPGVRGGIQAAYNQERYSMAPGPESNMMVGMGITINLDHKAVVESNVRWRQMQASAREYKVQDSRDMNGRLPGSGYNLTFRNALQNSPTLNDFVRNTGATNTDAVLKAVSSFSRAMGTFNYNENEGSPTLNVEDNSELYKRTRASYLTNRDDATLVCMGEAQFIATLANEMAKAGGVELKAMATTVRVTNEQGQGSGHAVATIKTKEYGIVFVDWGRLTPTYTWNTEKAFRIFDALQGIPDMYHEITTGPEGKHVGYLWTYEGQLFANKLSYRRDVPVGRTETLFEDDPNSAQVTRERYKNLLNKAFNQ